MNIHGLPTPALVIDADLLNAILATMAAAGLGDDLLLANEVLDPARLASPAAAQDSANATFAVADVGLKAMGMDHGKPSVETFDGHSADVWLLHDEHGTFVPHAGVAVVGDRVRVDPAHIDPAVAMHETAWLVRGHEVVEMWPIHLRGW